MILGGSTNAVLHLIAMAHSVGIDLTIDDFQNVSDRTPFLADIKPSGKYVMEDVYKLGGIPSKLRYTLPDLIQSLSSLCRNPGILVEEQAHRWQQSDCDWQNFRRES
jgi:dihydroxy-acid dehydratase